MPARVERRALKDFDWALFLLFGVLLALGFGNLFSATHPGASEGEMSAEFQRQLVALAIGGVGFALALVFDYRRFERLAIPIYIAACLLTASTLVLAPLHRGSQSWLFFGPLRLQPSEFARVGLVLALARIFVSHPPTQITRLRDLWRPGLVIAIPVAIIVLQRDMGVAVLTLLVGATYLPFVRIPWRAWAAVGAAGAAALVGVWLFVFADYQRARVLDFIEPGRDPLASGYQVIQSRIAIGSGGLFGKGWLEGTQTQLRFLPTQHTDFIFSVVAEEWGFLGSAVVLGLYLMLLLWGLIVARRARDPFGAMLAVGVVGILFWPAMINVAMVLGLFPVIGVALPLFSYGGSAMIATLTALGLLLNVSTRRFMF
jgi:rod shape determining protein RodA